VLPFDIGHEWRVVKAYDRRVEPGNPELEIKSA
jgi:hypothetical protein